MKCKQVRRLIQGYLDDSLILQESAEIEHHLPGCAGCRRELEELRALQQMVQGLHRRRPPDDLDLRIRIAASKSKDWISLKQISERLSGFMSPLAIPAFSGVALTGLTFVFLLSTLFTGASLRADDNDAALAFFTRPRARSLAMLPFAPFESLAFMKGPVTVETLVGNDGRVIDYRVLSGPRDAESRKILDQFLYFGVTMDPATVLGRPTTGTLVITLSFYPTTNDKIDVLG